MVNAGILVPMKTLQVLLADVDHLDKASSSTLSILLGYSQMHRNVQHPCLGYKQSPGTYTLSNKTWKRDAKLRGMTERFLALPRSM